jgi:hypothetical protein
MKIGLSLSFCIHDLIAGRVREEDVSVIVTNTRAPDDTTWDRLMASYGRSYWRDNAQASIDLATLLRKEGRIVQPRTRDPSYAHRTPGADFWIEVPSFSR